MASKGHWLRVLGIGTAASALVLGTVSSGWAGSTTLSTEPKKSAGSGETARAGDARKAARNGTKSITLVTGDRVLVSGKNYERKAITRAPGRNGISFHAYTDKGHLFVVPSDLRGMVRTGRLDRRLFDITALIDQGYDDVRSRELGLIVESPPTTVRNAGLRVGRDLGGVGSTSLKVAKQDLAGSWKKLLATKGRIWLDARRKVDLSESVPQIGAPKAWDLGYTGKGTTVAIVDTGVDAAHADLAGKVTAKDFTGEGVKDGLGHGTHVASIVAGTGAASSGKYKGVAPDANVLSAKVCTSNGGCEDSDIIAGLRWAASTMRARVINVSLGSWDYPGLDPVESAINSLTKETGALFVASAGNYYELDSPATADSALAVGAVDKKDVLAEWSGVGPRQGDNGIKPDLTAPGVDIAAARAAGTNLGTPVNASYTALSGSSMAAPHVAGAAALLAQLHPDWKAAQIKNALTGGAISQPGVGLFQQGSGRVDIGRSITQNVVASAPSLSFGKQLFPHTDDVAVNRGLVYTNSSKEAVVLDLSASMTDPEGNPAPEGALKLTVSKLEIPAGGSARVGVVSNTNHSGPTGQYTGVVTATSGDLRLTTPVAVLSEDPHYEVTVKTLDRSGQPTEDAFTVVTGDGVYEEVEGTATLRLPKGRYMVETTNYSDDNEAWLIRPNLVVDKTLTTTADSRLAKPVKLKGPDPQARLGSLAVSYFGNVGPFGGSGTLFVEGGTVYTASLGSGATADEFAWSVDGQFEKTGTGGYASTVYNLHYDGASKFITGFSKTVASTSELAKVTNYVAQQKAGRKTIHFMFPSLGVASGVLVKPVSSYIAYVTPGPWSGRLEQTIDEFEDYDLVLEGPEKPYAAAKAYTTSWNKGAFGPAFPKTNGAWVQPGSWADRFDNVFLIFIPMYTDQYGNAGDSNGTGKTVLYRNSVKIDESDSAGHGKFFVASGSARYRLATTDTRTVSDFTTKSLASWTFNAAATDGPLALWGIRFTPALDPFNKTTGGRLGTLPISMQANPGATVGTPTLQTLEVSFNDGASWAKAGFKSTGAGRWEAKPTYPLASKAKYVSVRATGKDSLGNVVAVTLIRAYGLK